MPQTLVRSAATFKRLQSTAREALRAALELERVLDSDLFGRYRLEAGEPINDENVGEVVQLLHVARETYPFQELEIIVIAHPGRDKESDNGSTGDVQRH